MIDAVLRVQCYIIHLAIKAHKATPEHLQRILEEEEAENIDEHDFVSKKIKQTYKELRVFEDFKRRIRGQKPIKIKAISYGGDQTIIYVDHDARVNDEMYVISIQQIDDDNRLHDLQSLNERFVYCAGATFRVTGGAQSSRSSRSSPRRSR